jgi:PDZ domain-containing secreted protein
LEIKDILYQAISDYEEKKIVSDIAQGESSEAISTIFSHCVSSLDKTGDNRPETRSALAEGLTHYMLTVALIPSQRKTTLGTTDIDVAVPDSKTLSSSPEDAVIICFSKTGQIQTIKEQVDKLKKIQPKYENIWIVTDKPILSDAKVYSLDGEQFTFANIINDLISFSSNKKQSRLKIFRI